MKLAAFPELRKFPAGVSVPKVIHQLYPTRALPSRLLANVEHIQLLNPGWTYHLYDDAEMEEVVRAVYGRVIFDYYIHINARYGASRADFFRYLLIYAKGGVYLDIKSSMTRSLDEVIAANDVYVLARWPNGKGRPYEGWGIHKQLKHAGGREFQNWHIIAARGHPFLRAVIAQTLKNIEGYNPLFHNTGMNGVLRMTGPIAYTQAITTLLGQSSFRLASDHEELGLRYSIFDAQIDRAHKTLFTVHYSELNEPLTVLAGRRKIAWAVLGPVYIHVLGPLRRFALAVSRRLHSYKQWAH